ncbi:VOC family protein [Brachybacterium sp. ACRRE]|uniref:VOC family protein n=1 Tax=Brachybacterium sp. ACRRE TaxID=2918184 RepID=UPI001EF34696|nr:VOC family protein [Brachybacterium sp. ACRRE]MCG7310529.1 VOC family protein [Brachybacterium sp. ACRRE]
MDQRITLITLGVSDLRRSTSFYEALGWRGQEVEETVFFQAGGMGLVLWSREKLARDSGVPGLPSGDGFDGIVLAQNLRSAAEVDDLIARAESAGAAITRAPAETFYGGYAGCFADPDGHLWEIAFNPGFPLEDDGSLRIPELG